MFKINLSDFSLVVLLDIIYRNDKYIATNILESISKININNYNVIFRGPGPVSLILESIQEGIFDIHASEEFIERKVDRKRLEHALESNLPLWVNLPEYLQKRRL